MPSIRTSIPAAQYMSDDEIDTTQVIKDYALTSYRTAAKAFEKGISASNYVRLRIAMCVHQAAQQLGRHSSLDVTQALCAKWATLGSDWNVEKPWSERDDAIYVTLHKAFIKTADFVD